MHLLRAGESVLVKSALLILALSILPAEAIRPGTYRKAEPRHYSPRFAVSKWELYTDRGWRPTYVEDRHLNIRVVNYRTRVFVWRVPQPCHEPLREL